MKRRYLFIDVLRGLAILEMIHGHTLDALLSSSLRHAPFFIMWTYVRAFTAPLFLFAAGFAFAISTLPTISEYTRWSKKLLRRVRRILFIVILGYCLYLPFFSLQKTVASIGSPAWHDFLSVDILRCIGVSILLLQFWHFFNPRRCVSLMCMAVLMLGIPLVTPLVSNSMIVSCLPDLIKYYFVHSRFSLFPYAAYVFLGMFIGQLYVDSRSAWRRNVLVLSIVVFVGAGIFRVIGLHPTFASFLLTSGAVLLLCWILERLESLWQRTPSSVLCFGQESLIIYVVHLILLYGSVLNKGLRYFWGPLLAYPEVYGVFIWLSLAMSLLAFVWHWLKIDHAVLALRVKYSFYVWFLVLFMIRPY